MKLKLQTFVDLRVRLYIDRATVQGNCGRGEK